MLYFHENQLTYPLPSGRTRDLAFPWINYTSALAADACLFNTRWNLEGFLAGIPPFLRQFPDHHPVGVSERIAAKSGVLGPPFDPAPFDGSPVTRGDRCRIVWPHRWEHDKDPDAFFSAVAKLAEVGDARRDAVGALGGFGDSAFPQKIFQDDGESVGELL